METALNTEAVKKSKVDRPSLKVLAMKFYEEQDGSTVAAIEAMVEYLAENRDVMRAIVEDEIEGIVGESIRHENRRVRGEILAFARGKAIVSVKPVKNHLKAMATSVKRMLLDFPLMDGTPLKDAKAADLEPTITHYFKQANSMTHTGRWLKAVQAAAPDADKRIGSQIDEEQVQSLFNESKLEVDDASAA